MTEHPTYSLGLGKSLVRRWENIAAGSGLLIAVIFVAHRFFHVRGLWSEFSWTDLRDLGGFGLFILTNAAELFGIVVVLWSGYVWLWKPAPDRAAERRPPIARSMLRVVKVAVLSVVLAVTIEGLAKMRTPGWWIASKVNKPGNALNLRLFIGSSVVMDSTICFAILWGGYALWIRFRFRDPVHRSNE